METNQIIQITRVLNGWVISPPEEQTRMQMRPMYVAETVSNLMTIVCALAKNETPPRTA